MTPSAGVKSRIFTRQPTSVIPRTCAALLEGIDPEIRSRVERMLAVESGGGTRPIAEQLTRRPHKDDALSRALNLGLTRSKPQSVPAAWARCIAP